MAQQSISIGGAIEVYNYDDGAGEKPMNFSVGTTGDILTVVNANGDAEPLAPGSADLDFVQSPTATPVVDNALPKFDTTTGKLIQETGIIVDDSNNMTGINNLTLGGDIIVPSPTVPASASATGVAGTISWDSGFIYICVSTDSWKRTAIAVW